MIPANETFVGTFPFAPHLSTAADFRMHYVNEGKGELIVCLHGEPTWGYLYRHFIPIFQSGFPDAPVIELENAGHFCQEDQPDTFVALIDQFM